MSSRGSCARNAVFYHTQKMRLKVCAQNDVFYNRNGLWAGAKAGGVRRQLVMFAYGRLLCSPVVGSVRHWEV